MSRQSELMKYGVPDLKETADRLLSTTEHLLSPDEMQVTKKKAKQLVEGEEGRKLQKLLEERAKNKDNWVFCFNY